VLADVQRNIFSLEMAREVFGVIINPEAQIVDEKSTKVQREKIRAKRRERGKVWDGE
jgi:hypothetical protein